MMRFVDKTKYLLKPWIEDNVYIQYCAFAILYHCPFLLPHDSDFHGVAHLPLDEDSDGILDVGANLGLSALSFRRLAPTLKVLSLEPNPIHEHPLQRIQRRDSRFRYLMVGAGRASAQTALHVPYYGKVALHTMAAVDRDTLEASCAAQYGRRARHIHFRTVPIRIVPIDDLDVNPSLIKIDAEGFEEAIVEGALQTIRRSRPFLLVENNSEPLAEITKCLGPLGYERYFWDGASHTFTTREATTRNVYLLPREKLQGVPCRAA
jgi:FkbM family methyltransferase